MASRRSSGLKELLASSPLQTPKSPRPVVSSSSSSSSFGVGFALKIKELSGSGSSQSSLESIASSPPLPFPISLSPESDQGAKKKLGKEKEAEDVVENGSRQEKNLGKERQQGTDDMEKSINADARSSSISGKCFPPPISVLKRVKTGIPYCYVRFDEETQSYVTEEIKIPYRGLFRASRADGRLRLYLDLSDNEDEEEE